MRQNSFMSDDWRALAWFSCGASSAVAAKMTVDKYGERARIIYCDTSEDEHPDNQRFLLDVQEWLGVEIEKIKSEEYQNCFDVYERTRFLVSPAGARCTTELKRIPARKARGYDDINIYGFTADKKDAARAIAYARNNPEQRLEFPLIEAGITKADCMNILASAGIEPSAMYALGFNNANCCGCVKVRSPNYWRKIRHHFPARFNRLAEISRGLEYRLIRYTEKGETVYLFLDELDERPADFADVTGETDIACGIMCGEG